MRNTGRCETQVNQVRYEFNLSGCVRYTASGPRTNLHNIRHVHQWVRVPSWAYARRLDPKPTSRHCHSCCNILGCKAIAMAQLT